MLIQIPLQHIITVDIDKLIAHCDSTQLNELILLADRKLRLMEQYPEEEPENIKENTIDGKVISISKF